MGAVSPSSDFFVLTVSDGTTMYDCPAPTGSAHQWMTTAAPHQPGLGDTSSVQFLPQGTALASLRRMGQPVVVGHEVVRGLPTTEYQLMPPLVVWAPGFSSFPSGIAQQPVEVRLWVDRSGLARRLSTTDRPGAPGLDASTTFTIEYLDLGAPITIHVPAPSATVPASAVTAPPRRSH